MTSPRQIFEDNTRPADLLLRVYRMLDTDDQLLTEGELIDALRKLVDAGSDEDLMLVYNEIFLGLIREGANMPRATLKRSMLANLLRQAVVASCTGLDTYLPVLLSTNLPIMIRAKGRDAIPVSDGDISEYFKDLTFGLDETLRLVDETNRSGSDEYAAQTIAEKILKFTKFQYLSSSKGIQVVGKLLSIDQPWDRITEHLGREKRELKSILDATVRRRNDIVHRADRSQDDPQGDSQDITYAWTRQAVDTVQHICLALDELVAVRVKEYEAVVAA